MQRQSLGGSPSSKLHLHGAAEDKKKKKTVEEDENHSKGVSLEDEEAGKKIDKQQQQRIEKSIHLIPVLIIFCLLILYLSSYDPPQKDLARIRGFNTRPSDELDRVVKESKGIHKLLEDLKGGDMLGIGSQRGLLKHGAKPRPHRKLGDF